VPTRLIRSLIPLPLLALVATALAGAAPKPKPADPPPGGNWVNVSDPTVNQLVADGKKLDWPGNTAGVAVDSTNGDVYMVVPGQGLWKSTDAGRTFARTDDGHIGGRCETAFALNVDPAGGRIACFMLDGKCAMSLDAGKTWAPFKEMGRNWDYAAVDWSGKEVRNIFAERHEVGGEAYLSTDGGQSWKLLFKDAEFDKTGGLGIFDDKTLVRTQKGKGIERSTDAGQTWAKVSDLQPWGRVVRVRGGVAYWLSKDGLLVSKDKGATWAKQGTAVDASIGPFFDPKDERHLSAAGPKGIFETADAGETWKPATPLPAKFDVPMAGWFTNVGWDPGRGIFYASRMGKPTYKAEAKPQG
jgi:BNR/Asp-box repeat protein